MTGPSNDLPIAQRKYARWVRLQLMFELPRLADILLASKLWERDGEFWLVVDGATAPEPIEIIGIALERERPVTLRISVAVIPPSDGVEISTAAVLSDEAWLVDHPLTQWELNALLSLADSSLPFGFLDFDIFSKCYEFVSPVDLSFEDMQRVRSVANDKLEIPLQRFRTSTTDRAHPAPANVLPVARQSQALPTAIRQLLESDEDEWRDFCNDRDQGALTAQSSLAPQEFSGLVEADGQGAVTLADLLAIYDVVHLMPPQSESAWLKANGVSLTELQQLAMTGRMRLVLPRSLQSYPVGLVSALAEAAPEAITLSRSLAVRAIREGQKRDPLLHAPISYEAKAALLGALVHVLPDKLAAAACQMYQNPLKHQRSALPIQGAGAWYHQSLGARLGAALFQRGGPDARLELMTAGAALEWGMALGASYMPRRYGDYDETRNAVYIASLISKVPPRQIMPATDSLHRVVHGLLTIGDLSPMEAAQLAPGSRLRFRKLASRLMTEAIDADDLQHAVDAINSEVTNFERKRELLKRLEIRAMAGGFVGKALGDSVDTLMPLASVIGAWLALLAKRRLPKGFNDELDAFIKSLIGMALLTPIDAVIVSQARDAVAGVRKAREPN